jgi:tetratricopeptide (TPR) repeat protein
VKLLLACVLALLGVQEDVMQRDPRALATCEGERWSTWKPSDPVPEDLRAALGAGMRSYFEADYTSALAAFFELLEREPDFPPALYQAGLTYFRLRRYGDSQVLFERFLRAVPHEIGATRALGHCYYSLGEYQRALEHYRKLLEVDPDSVETLRGCALAHMRLGHEERALEWLARALELREDHEDVHGWMAQILFELGRSEEALSHARRARDLSPAEPRHWFLLSRILIDLDRDEEALAARGRFETLDRIAQEVRRLEGQLLHDPRRLAAWLRLAELHRSSGSVEGLRESLSRALALAPNDVKLYVAALDALMEVADQESARSVASALERACPDEVEGWKRLIAFYKSIGDRVGEERAALNVDRLAR